MKPHERMLYAQSFNYYFGVTPKELVAMPIQEFQQKLNFILDQPPLVTTKPKPAKRDTMSEAIKNDQDIEYVQALSYEKAKEMELETQMRELEKLKREDEEKKKSAREQLVQQKNSILDLSKELPDEPEDGICIAVVLPNGKRVQRKFPPTSKGKIIYQWISGFEEMFENELTPIRYTLVQVLGVKVIEDETLQEQKMRNRVLLNVLIED